MNHCQIITIHSGSLALTVSSSLSLGDGVHIQPLLLKFHCKNPEMFKFHSFQDPQPQHTLSNFNLPTSTYLNLPQPTSPNVTDIDSNLEQGEQEAKALPAGRGWRTSEICTFVTFGYHVPIV